VYRSTDDVDISFGTPLWSLLTNLAFSNLGAKLSAVLSYVCCIKEIITVFRVSDCFVELSFCLTLFFYSTFGLVMLNAHEQISFMMS
jgi:hypothetical protein